MSYGETENLVAETQLREEIQAAPQIEQTEQTISTPAPLYVSPSNQEAMLSQALKRLKKQGREIDRLVKIVKQISADSAVAGKNQAKQLKLLQSDISKLSTALKRVQSKSQVKKTKKTKGTRKAKATRRR